MTRPRTLVVSARKVLRPAWSCSIYEAEDVISGIEDVDLLCLQPRKRGTGRWMNQVHGVLWRVARAGLVFHSIPEKIKLIDHYDLFYFHITNANELWLLDAIPKWRKHCDIAICRLEESYCNGLGKPGKFERLREFNHIIMPKKMTLDPLRTLLDRPCHWQAPAVDTLGFCPWPTPPRRTIDFYMMGRRPRITHQRLKEYAASKGSTYLFDTVRIQQVNNPIEHRYLLQELIQRTRYFHVSIAKADAQDERGSQEELSYRFFEGAAGGAVLIGQPPRNTTFKECFGWEDSVIPFPWDADEPIGDLLDELDSQPDRIERIRRENVRQSLLHHDWAYRWRQVLDLAGLPPSPKLEEREALLRKTARLVESSKE